MSHGGLSGYPYQSSYRNFSPYSSPFGGMNPYGSAVYPSSGSDGTMGSSEFVRFAEDSSRPAFETIFSIVNGFNSVSMMLDSTYHAFQASFRSILAVVEQGSRMKLQFGQILSSFALLRSLKSCYRRMLAVLTGKPAVSVDLEDGFNSATSSSALTEDKKPHSSWPVIVYLGIVFSAPYFLWKIMSKGEGQKTGESEEKLGWASGKDDHIVAVAEHSFQGRNKSELSFQKHQEIKIAPKEKQENVRGWLVASVDGKTIGLIPANYVRIQGKVVSPKPDLVSNVAGSAMK